MTPEEIALARAGRITSTRVGTIMTGNYRAWNTLADKIRRAYPAPIGQRGASPATDWGLSNESRAAAEFWWRHPEYNMEEEPFRYWNDPRDRVHWERCSTSPDRTLYRFGELVAGLEVKCPYDPGIHRRYWSEGVLPEEYKPQVYWHLIVTDVEEWWFVSFDPREAAGHNYWEFHVERNHAYEAEMMAKVDRFIGGLLSGETFKPIAHDYRAIF